MSTTTTPLQPVSSGRLIADQPSAIYADRTYAGQAQHTGATQYADTTSYAEPAAPRPANRTGIDSRRFWIGTALTAGITALVALIALIIGHDLLHVPMLISDGGRLIAVGFGAYVLMAAAIAVAASVIYHVILRFAPRPRLYYSWLAVLGTLLAVLLPLTAGAAFVDQVTLAAINLVVGLVITGLVPVAAVKQR